MLILSSSFFTLNNLSVFLFELIPPYQLFLCQFHGGVACFGFPPKAVKTKTSSSAVRKIPKSFRKTLIEF